LESVRDLRYEVAQLDLLASRAVRRVAGALVTAHQHEALRLIAGKPGEDDYPARRDGQVKITDLELALIETTRTDLGLDRFEAPPGSLLGRMLAPRMTAPAARPTQDQPGP
jgi:hypothetical protein